MFFARFTRDEVSSWVWWPATLVLLVLFVLSFPGETRAIEDRRADASARAWSLAVGTIAPALESLRGDTIPPEPTADLATLVQERILGDPWTEVVRIWSPDGTLLWSSDPVDPVGSAGALNDDDISRSLEDLTRATEVVSDRDVNGNRVDRLTSAYAPFTLGASLAVAQFEVPDDTLLADVRNRWLGARIILGVAGLITFAFALGSMRDPVAKIGAGVVLTDEPPSGMELIDADRKLELESAEEDARIRLADMERRLRESEERRARAERDLQRALAQLAAIEAGDADLPDPGRPVAVPDDVLDLSEHDPEAQEVLERLVEPVGARTPAAEDPSALRAKLARTAALKKPGSRRDERPHGDDPTS